MKVPIQVVFHYREDGGSQLLRNVGTHKPIYITSYSIKFKTSFVGWFKQLITTVSIYTFIKEEDFRTVKQSLCLQQNTLLHIKSQRRSRPYCST